MTEAQFTFRPWKDKDIPTLIRHLSTNDIRRKMAKAFHGAELLPEDADDTLRWIHARIPRSRELAIIDPSGEISGGIRMHVEVVAGQQIAQLEHWLAADIWGKSLEKQVVRKMIALLTESEAIAIASVTLKSRQFSDAMFQKAGWNRLIAVQWALPDGLTPAEVIAWERK